MHSKSNAVVWLSAKKASKHANLTLDMVNYLCRYDIVKPSGCTKRGRGCIRKYTLSDVILLRVIGRLLSNGISVLRLRKSLMALQKRKKFTDDILVRKYLATDGKTVYFHDGETIESIISGQLSFAFVLELEAVRNEVIPILQQEQKLAVG